MWSCVLHQRKRFSTAKWWNMLCAQLVSRQNGFDESAGAHLDKHYWAVVDHWATIRMTSPLCMWLASRLRMLPWWFFQILIIVLGWGCCPHFRPIWNDMLGAFSPSWSGFEHGQCFCGVRTFEVMPVIGKIIWTPCTGWNANMANMSYDMRRKNHVSSQRHHISLKTNTPFFGTKQKSTSIDEPWWPN